ncbi:MAG: 50S ribosomal protein L11 methyltransferase [Clostridia bacterium]|nr:50S ribosomal protein L11 methyltransferase [Clostridia bacterium]
MEWLELTVHTTTQGADLVSQQMMALGADGTQIQDRADIPDPAKPNGYWELIDQSMIDNMPEDVLVQAWFPLDEKLPERIASLKNCLNEMQALPGMGSLDVTSNQVKDEDWSQVWKKFYKPFRAGRSLVVNPSWETYDAQPGDKIIEIDPGMAFGTGTHETTGMCLGLLDDYMTPGMRVIDLGTGSGILAIGAALLGAKDVLAIDIDPTAVKVAQENVAINGLSDNIQVMEGNLLDHVEQVCDLCVANIIADVICMVSEPVRSHITPGGLFICSGIIKEREQDVVNALNAAGYQIMEIRRQGEWVAMISKK